MLFETLTHQRMFQRNSEYLIARAILEEAYPDAHAVAPAVPPSLAAVLARALARRPEERFATAQEMGAALRESVAELGGPLPPPAIGDRLRRLYADSLAEQRGQLERATSRVEAAPALADDGAAGREVDVSTEPVPRPGSAAAQPAETTAPTRLLRGSGSAPVVPADATPTAPVSGRPRTAAIGAVALVLAGALTLFWLLRRPDGAASVSMPDGGVRLMAPVAPAATPPDAAVAEAAPAVERGGGRSAFDRCRSPGAPPAAPAQPQRKGRAGARHHR